MRISAAVLDTTDPQSLAAFHQTDEPAATICANRSARG